ncbi:hypothetical protein H2201_006424 [Coniosporium apollinis]|uniref:Bud22 domain-containing protein n=1 Tax=Coniosporium apollinis TaxID=61459 RepID=A0ABQ9NNI3_9PEZI|nr:hypothetical protein H2201_006424 [Coniosporium apollinis]
MPKRKRSDFVGDIQDDRHSTDGPINARQYRVEQKINHGKKLLNRALKLAKGFERQKLGRRQKTASQKGDAAGLARIDAEIEALKKLDIADAAETYLYKTLLKIKTIAASPSLPASVKLPSKAPPDTSTANVTARLYNANPVKEAMGDILSDIRNALGVEQAGEAGRKNATKTGVSERDHAKSRLECFEQGASSKSVSASSAGSKEEVENAYSDEFSDPDSEDFAHLDARVAGSSAEGSDEDSEEVPVRSGLLRGSARGYDPADDLSLSPSAFSSSSQSPESESKASVSKAAANANKISTFLPSLTMGGYWSGSESLPSDEEVDVAPRKNRRGQRARQQLWEKKFGGKAKHLQKQDTTGNNNRHHGWDPKRGAQGEGDKRFGQRRTGEHSTPGTKRRRGGDATPANGAELVPSRQVKGDDQGPLHPSWEAAKQRKEQRATAPFQGKKVVFD